MLGDRSDTFYGARLVADARLHLGAIMNGQYSEPFFVTMCKIMSQDVYLGYTTFTGKEVKLSGIKDFLYSSLYGLGLKPATINIFLSNCSKAAINDKTQTQYSMRFIKWLQAQDPIFAFPQELFEYKRLRYWVACKYKRRKSEMWLRLGLLLSIYNQKPHLLQDIGVNRKYPDVVQCAEENDISEVSKKLRPIELYKNPTVDQVRKLAEKLDERLDRRKKRVLIANLIELYRLGEQEDDSEAAGDN